MVDSRTNFAKGIINKLEEAYGRNVKIFEEYIPVSVRAAETSAEGKGIYMHDPKCKVASAYSNLTKEVLEDE